MGKQFFAIILLLMLFVVSCSDSAPPVQFNIDVPGCSAGATNACACPNGMSGIQKCENNGHWGECECPDAQVIDEGLVRDVQAREEVTTAIDSEITEISENDLDAQAIDEDVLPDIAKDDYATPDDYVNQDEGAVGRDVDVNQDPGTGCPGNAGCFCMKNADCNSGFCIENATGHECADFCTGDKGCGDGYTCTGVSDSTGDTVHICVYRFPNLCRQCQANADCAAVYTNDGSLCVAWIPEMDAQGNGTGNYVPGYGNEGAFCGTPCQMDVDCKDGYICRPAESTDGQMAKQCVLKTGSCGCTDKASLLNSLGSCYVRNEFGTCKGTHQCRTSGVMTRCTAKSPKAEICNHQDDNCNGQTDEGFDLKTDVNNCGECNTMCLNLHGRTSCVDEKCAPVCNEGYWDCDKNLMNGCEGDLSVLNICGICANNKDCPDKFICKAGQCVKQFPGGHKCDTAEVCAGGFCTDEGVCCDQACDGPCQSCSTGTCKPVTRGGQPETASACGGFLCDGNGACLEGCRNDWDCLDSYFCEQGTGSTGSNKCKPDMDLGGNCTAAGSQACKSGFCADGVCCDSTCGGTCQHCSTQGKCGKVINAEDHDTCGGKYTCDAKGVCLLKTGQLCSNGDNCLSRICQDGVCCATTCNGVCKVCTAQGCVAVKGQDDISTCTNTKTCDANGNCVLKAGQVCNKDADCGTDKCKPDYDGTGKWCGAVDKCFHDGLAYNSGDFSMGCWDNTDQAHCRNGNWEKVSCGDSGCDGTCGSGLNGCQYDVKTCESGKCKVQLNDVDSMKAFCTACGLNWDVGGDTAQGACCGDDPAEYLLKCKVSSSDGKCGTDDMACCKSGTDCVDQMGNCTASGMCYAFGSNNTSAFCGNNQWNDPDDSQKFCEAAGCGYTWLAKGNGATAKCCGDDPGEDFAQSPGSYRKCCYNAKAMDSGAISGSILCYNGSLYNCNGYATDDSGISVIKNTCEPAGAFYCNSDNTWKPTLENNCPCQTDTACKSGHCKADYDDSGNWCAEASKCVHNNQVYNSGDFSEECYSASERVKCTNGIWSVTGCGTNTACATYSCKAGQCKTTYNNTGTQCNNTFACSTGLGNDKYNKAGNYRCQGYCDGSGNCDFAGNCTNCADRFPNAAGSCGSGDCIIGACNPGWANCDADPKTGCEVHLDNNKGSFSSAAGLSDICGDNGCKAGDTKQARGEEWFKIKVKECSGWSVDLEFEATLKSPVNTNYDLYLYDSGRRLKKSSTNTTTDDTVKFSWKDRAGKSDTRTLYLEVRYVSGVGCGKWTLSTRGGCD